MDNLINVGTDVRSVEAMRKAILEILKLNRDREVTVTALQTLRDGVQVHDVNFSHCSLVNNPEKPVKKAKTKGGD